MKKLTLDVDELKVDSFATSQRATENETGKRSPRPPLQDLPDATLKARAPTTAQRPPPVPVRSTGTSWRASERVSR